MQEHRFSRDRNPCSWVRKDLELSQPDLGSLVSAELTVVIFQRALRSRSELGSEPSSPLIV